MHTLTHQRYAVCVIVKRGLQSAQKRPIHLAKEAYEHTYIPEVLHPLFYSKRTHSIVREHIL